jgi:ketosteroid isomerase-like protein
MTQHEKTDNEQIIDTMIAMVSLADKREWEALVNVFTEKVTADYTALIGGEVQPVLATELVAGWEKSFADYAATQHMVTNQEVQLDGETATGRAYFQATHSKPDGSLWILGGRYQYTFVKQREWRIQTVTMIPIWAREERNIL